MIVIISSKDCPHCEAQMKIMRKSFFEDEYRVIDLDSPEFAKYENRDFVEGVPSVVVTGEDGVVRFAKLGVVEGAELRNVERQVKRAYLFPDLRGD